jgi:hypothetical protein
MDSKLMTSQAAREHVFPILVAELVKEGIMVDAHGGKLLSLFQHGNQVVKAALDVYDMDNDMAELVDTLQRLIVASNQKPAE